MQTKTVIKIYFSFWLLLIRLKVLAVSIDRHITRRISLGNTIDEIDFILRRDFDADNKSNRDMFFRNRNTGNLLVWFISRQDVRYDKSVVGGINHKLELFH